MKASKIVLSTITFLYIGFVASAQTTASNISEDLSQPNFVEIHEDGTTKQSGFIIKNKNEGNWTQFHQNGNIAVEGNYASGKKTGEWKYYDQDGMLTGQVLWVKDRALYKQAIEGSIAKGIK